MASALDSILDLVKRKVSEGAQQKGGAGGILGQLTDMLGKRTASASRTGGHNVRPASEDKYGDPADEKGARKVRPASEDPFGDPADEKR